MDELTAEQIEELGQALRALRAELEGLLEATREGTRPVDLDEPIGRLTRMEAIQPITSPSSFFSGIYTV